jgi:hypothetical protein
VATPTHDAYLENGTLAGLTVGTYIIAYAFGLVNIPGSTNFYKMRNIFRFLQRKFRFLRNFLDGSLERELKNLTDNASFLLCLQLFFICACLKMRVEPVSINICDLDNFVV